MGYAAALGLQAEGGFGAQMMWHPKLRDRVCHVAGLLSRWATLPELTWYMSNARNAD